MPFRTIRFAACFALLIGQWSPAYAQPPNRVHIYEVELDPGLDALRVRACFSGELPRYLMAESLDASGALREARIEGARRPIEPNGTELKLQPGLHDTCVRYEVDISAAATRHERGGNLTVKVGDDLVLDIGLWFWRPGILEADEDIRVAFTLPEGYAVSVPWQRLDGEGRNVFLTGRSPYDWPAVAAFGRFTENLIEVPGSTLHLVVLGVTSKIPADRISEWMLNAAMGVTTLYGKFPVPRARVLVIPNAQGNEPVPWAFVQRGGGPSAQFLINHRLPGEDFVSDWTLFHELAHMLFPYINSQDAWLSEGMASYYQNVLRARRGVITTLDAWQRLHAGFERGRRSQVGATLASATERMYRNAGYMRVYWQGAAIMLLADYRLRVRTQGRQSLDRAMAGIAQCCLKEPLQWRGQDLMAKMDEITGTTVFSELYAQHTTSPAFADLTEVYEGLGLVVREKEVQFLDSAPHRELRELIMQTPQSIP